MHNTYFKLFTRVTLHYWVPFYLKTMQCDWTEETIFKKYFLKCKLFLGPSKKVLVMAGVGVTFINCSSFFTSLTLTAARPKNDLTSSVRSERKKKVFFFWSNRESDISSVKKKDWKIKIYRFTLLQSYAWKYYLPSVTN